MSEDDIKTPSDLAAYFQSVIDQVKALNPLADKDKPPSTESANFGPYQTMITHDDTAYELRRIRAELAEWRESERNDPGALPDQVSALELTGEAAKGATDYQAGPPRPGDNGATWDDTFDWYHSVPRSVCPSLRELAKMIGFAEGTVKNKHSEYLAQHSDQKSSRK